MRLCLIKALMLFGFSALIRATGMPITQDRITDRMAISAVSGPRRAIISATLSDRKKDRPKSPARMSFTQLRYCSHRGSLRPSAFM